MKTAKARATILVTKLAKIIEDTVHPANRIKLQSHVNNLLITHKLLVNTNMGGEGAKTGEGCGNGIESRVEQTNPKCSPDVKSFSVEEVTSESATSTSGGDTFVYSVDVGPGDARVSPESQNACNAKETGSVGVVEGEVVSAHKTDEVIEAVVFRACANPRFTECQVGARRVLVFTGGRVLRRNSPVKIKRDGGTEGNPLYRLAPPDRI